MLRSRLENRIIFKLSVVQLWDSLSWFNFSTLGVFIVKTGGLLLSWGLLFLNWVLLRLDSVGDDQWFFDLSAYFSWSRWFLLLLVKIRKLLVVDCALFRARLLLMVHLFIHLLLNGGEVHGLAGHFYLHYLLLLRSAKRLDFGRGEGGAAVFEVLSKEVCFLFSRCLIEGRQTSWFFIQYTKLCMISPLVHWGWNFREYCDLFLLVSWPRSVRHVFLLRESCLKPIQILLLRGRWIRGIYRLFLYPIRRNHTTDDWSSWESIAWRSGAFFLRY